MAVPYVVGQWVRGERFYGRRAQIAEILDGARNGIWVAGTRRVGKTSLLKQLEHLAASGERGFLPLFWDFQGAEDPDGLAESFADALYDVEEPLGRLGIAVGDIEGGGLFPALGRLRRRLRSAGRELLLLCDEVEELLHLRTKHPALLRKLRRALHAREGIRTVLVSSIRLAALAEPQGDTSPFLHGFSPPIYLPGLGDTEARALIRQTHLPAAERPRLSEAAVEEIARRSANHPYLLQLVSKRFHELGDLEEACEQVAADAMVSSFFAADFGLLGEEERWILRFVAQQSSVGGEAIQRAAPGPVDAALHRLRSLGLLRRDAEQRFAVCCSFFRRWLAGARGTAAATEPGDARREPSAGAENEDFRLGRWRVEPRLNRLVDGGEEVRLEPRVMDLLVFLSRHAGRVVSKEEIFDAVWESRFVTDSALTRVVADLRKALGDDVRRPRFIATLSKRGYRLIAPVDRPSFDSDR